MQPPEDGSKSGFNGENRQSEGGSLRMKKLVSLLLVFCLVLAVAGAAMAAGTPAFTKQPVDSTTDKYGNLTLVFRGTDFVANESSWHFIEPETGKEWTGPQLRDEMKARKVTGFKLTATEAKQVLYLEKVPKFMHGWEVYVVLANKGATVESDHIHVYWYGMDKAEVTAAAQPATPAELPAEQPEAPAEQPAETPVETPVEQPAEAPVETPVEQPAEAPAEQPAAEVTEVTEAEVEPEVPAGPKIITVTCDDKLLLYPVDSRGDAVEDQAATSITFEDSGSVAIRSEGPVKYWMVNGIRIEPDDSNLTGFVLKNITSDLNISAKLGKSSGSSGDDVDPDSPCEVTCSGCTFTYHKGGLKSVTSGTVPAGATIIVFTNDSKAAQNGFSINGGEPEHQGSTSFRLKIEDNTTISIP